MGGGAHRLPARILVAGRDLHIVMLDDMSPVHNTCKATGKGGGKTGKTGKLLGETKVSLGNHVAISTTHSVRKTALVISATNAILVSLRFTMKTRNLTDQKCSTMCLYTARV